MLAKPHRNVLMTVTAFVWVAAISASVGRFKLAAKTPLTISLSTQPENVRLHVDGERQFGGAYVATPVKVNLRPGRRKLRISRDGYAPHVVAIEGDAGENFRMDEVVLKKDKPDSFAMVEIIRDGAAVHVDIDDGLAQGETPFTTADLSGNTTHTLAAYSAWPDKEPVFRCRFKTVPHRDGEPPQRIKLKSKAGTVRSATGCQKTASRPR